MTHHGRLAILTALALLPACGGGPAGEAGDGDADSDGDGDTDADADGELSFEARGELDIGGGADSFAVVLVGHLAIDEAGRASGVLALEDGGDPVEVAGARDGEAIELEPVTLVSGDLLLDRIRTTVALDTIRLEPTWGAGGLDRVVVHGSGVITQNEGGDTLNYYEDPFTTRLAGGHDETPPRLEAYGIFEDDGRLPSHPTTPVLLVANEPVNVEALTSHLRLRTADGDEVALSVEVDEASVAGGYATRASVRARPYLPPDTTSVLDAEGGLRDLAGNGWDGEIELVGPPIGDTRVVPTSFEDGEAGGFLDPYGAPPVVEWPEPYATSGSHVLQVGAAGAWGLVELDPATTSIHVRLTYAVFVYTGYEDINDNPDWVFENLGYSVTAASATGEVSFEVDMLDRGFTAVAVDGLSSTHAVPPRDVQLDVASLGGGTVMLTFAPRSFLVSPMASEGLLLVDSVELVPSER